MARDPHEAARLRDAIKRAAQRVGPITSVPRVRGLDAVGFRALARGGCPFVVTDLVGRWPLARLDREALGERFGDIRVTVRKGDYVTHAFSGERESVRLSLRDFLGLPPHDAVAAPGQLPPYIGNQKIEGLNDLCQWPSFFSQYGVARTWFGPADTVTPLHCDYLENLFAQVAGRKRFLLIPPHHDVQIEAREVEPVLWASAFNPEAPDTKRFPLAGPVTACECIVEGGELLYLPAGWFHHVRALTDSLSVNRWADDRPLALADDGAVA